MNAIGECRPGRQELEAETRIKAESMLDSENGMSCSERNRSLVMQTYECFARGDLESIGRVLADAVIVEPAGLTYGGEYHGAAGLQKLMQAMAAVWDDLSFDVVHVVANDSIALAYARFSATGHATGEAISMPIVEAWHFAGDKVVRVEAIYGDTVRARAALTGTL